jgi:hypothetical protein
MHHMPNGVSAIRAVGNTINTKYQNLEPHYHARVSHEGNGLQMSLYFYTHVTACLVRVDSSRVQHSSDNRLQRSMDIQRGNFLVGIHHTRTL